MSVLPSTDEFRFTPYKQTSLAPRRHVLSGPEAAEQATWFCSWSVCVLAIRQQRVKKVTADLPERHANSHDCQCAQVAQLTGMPTKVRLS
jgi:hypothetical protein